MPEEPDTNDVRAPGWPGIPARWTSAVKSGVGTALSGASRVWFTLSHGILNEIYYPQVDSACTRDLGLVVTDGASYFSEEKRHTRSDVSLVAPGVPAFRLRNTAIDGRYRVDKDVLTDPAGDVVLQRVRFTPLEGSLANYRVFVILAPHLNNQGAGNTAWVGDYKGVPVLYAERDGHALALACSSPWLARSVGFVGYSDGWRQLRADGRLVTSYERAENGNVAMTAEVDLSAETGACVLALGFGARASEAGQHAVNSLITGFDAIASDYTAGWQRWHKKRRAPEPSDPDVRAFVAFSAAVMRVHESKSFRGGVIASLSVPWGFRRGDNDLGGYHLVWPRDLVETAGGFLAVGAHEDARRVLRFLQVTQEADGHWCQNMWLDGSPYWTGIQMDETAMPILLVDLAERTGAVEPKERRYWPMIRRAASFLVRHGPVSPQDRWEEDPGYSPFTLAAEVAALLVAADAADAAGEAAVGQYLRDTADAWNAAIDEWMYVTDTDLARQCGVDGYYVRAVEPDASDLASPADGVVRLRNRRGSESVARAAETVSPDALALVRFGLRAAGDPRILNTVTVIDKLLRVDTPHGPAWRRYNGDGYGEHEDGTPFDGTGVGRPWPLLTGERGHYELAAGHADRAEELARAMQALAGKSQLLPEQVWDAQDVPGRELFKGAATGSARPLVWAHAEYVKLRRSLEDGRLFDQPRQTVERYVSRKAPASRLAVWRFNNKIRSMPPGKILRIETLAKAVVHVGIDGWSRVRDAEAVDTGLGVWVTDLDAAALEVRTSLDFTFYWPAANRWEGVDFRVAVLA